MGARIVVAQVSKRFKSAGSAWVDALRDISLEIAANEFVCLLGPSGCGKTTLLNMIAGLEPVSAGTITVDNEVVRGPSPRRGMVFQQYALFPWLTVRGNIEVGLRYQGVPRDVRSRIVDQLIETVGLREFQQAYPRELSGGMMQRVALARAYAPNPEVLLMDEPFGALDAQTKATLQEDLLRVWAQTQKTVVFVTHDVDEAVFLANRIVVFSRRPGRIHSVFPIPLPYPRTRQIRTTPEFFQMRSEIWETVYQLMEQ